MTKARRILAACNDRLPKYQPQWILQPAVSLCFCPSKPKWEQWAVYRQVSLRPLTFNYVPIDRKYALALLEAMLVHRGV